MKYRIEQDTLGQVKVPIDAYYGAQTQRARDNFQVSTLRLQPPFLRAQAVIKRAAALANRASGRLPKDVANAIVQAADEIIAGEYAEQFVVDVFQAGAGTSQNMNMNEVLANRATEILGGEKGDYSRVHPNDSVNMGQSTNDTIPTAIHLSAYTEIHDRLLPTAGRLEKSLKKKAKEFDPILKSGRTHLQDAVPMRLGQEFGAYAHMIMAGRKRIEHASRALLELPIGGTAVGTGLNTAPNYRKDVIRHINKASGHRFRAASNMFEAMQNMDAVVEVTGALRVLVTSLIKIADDLRLLTSGPRAGLGEIVLPAVQPGSSIMPGKINPVLAEMLNMVCYHALGCDTAVHHAARSGQLELNVMMPVIAYNFLLEIEILTGGMRCFTERCVDGITADPDTCQYYAERSAALATALSPYIGYGKAAELAKRALDENRTVRDLVLDERTLPEDKLKAILDIHKMTEDPSRNREKKKK